MNEVQAAEKVVRDLEQQQAILIQRSKIPSGSDLAATLAAAKARLESARVEEVERLAFLEKLKGPKGASARYVRPPDTPGQTEKNLAELRRLEELKKPVRLPPLPQPDFIQEQKQRQERLRQLDNLKGP